MVWDKDVCERWCETKMVCERWCVTKIVCDKEAQDAEAEEAGGTDHTMWGMVSPIKSDVITRKSPFGGFHKWGCPKNHSF